MTEQLFVHAWHNQTVVHPLGLAALLILGIAALMAPRQWAIVPMLVLICFIPTAQRFNVAGLDFHFLRIMVLIGWLRVALRGEMRGFRWKGLDTCIVAWAVGTAMIYIAGQSTWAAVINRTGFLYDVIGMYFLFRALIRNWDDVLLVARAAAYISVPVAIAFLVERNTGQNLFAIFGGVPEITAEREGSLRCQGAFAHPILAGVFWVALTPLILALWARSKTDSALAMVGTICCGVIVLASASSTPLIASFVAMAACALYFTRSLMPWLRLAIIPGLLALHLVMIAPIWHLLARLAIVPGSTSYYRFKLFDDFITHFSEWWLLGTDSVMHWWVHANGDITNMYVQQGINGGLLGLVLFLATIVAAFLALLRIRDRTEKSGRMQFASWALGVSLVVHCSAFMAVSYFGQITMIWFLLLAMIGSLASASPVYRVRVRSVSSPNEQHGGVQDVRTPITLPRRWAT